MDDYLFIVIWVLLLAFILYASRGDGRPLGPAARKIAVLVLVSCGIGILISAAWTLFILRYLGQLMAGQ